MSASTRTFTLRLRHTTVRTANLAESVRFYEDVLGLRRTAGDDDFVQVDAGGAQLCIDVDEGGEEQPRMVFAVDDLAALCRHLETLGIQPLAGGVASGWVMVRDPDGAAVAFEQ